MKAHPPHRKSRIIRTVEDVDEQVLRDADELLDSFEGEPRIDWERFIDRLAEHGALADPPYGFEDHGSPAVRKIQRHARAELHCRR